MNCHLCSCEFSMDPIEAIRWFRKKQRYHELTDLDKKELDGLVKEARLFQGVTAEGKDRFEEIIEALEA
jgi:hypothetical protein